MSVIAIPPIRFPWAWIQGYLGKCLGCGRDHQKLGVIPLDKPGPFRLRCLRCYGLDVPTGE